MSNIINKIRISGTDYTLSATTSGGVTSGEVETMISAATSGYTARFAEDEEVTAAALNDLNERISGISGNNVVELTQAQYDALVDKDPNTFYIISDASTGDLSQYWTSAQTQSAITQATSGITERIGEDEEVTAAALNTLNDAVSGKVDTSDFNTYSGSVETALSGKQDTLVSSTNIKTINNESILGSGNITIQGGSDINVVQTTGTSTTDVMSQDAVTTQLNNKANKSAAFGGYTFGSSSDSDYIQYKNVNNINIGNNIYYPKINGKGILTTNNIYARINYNFSLVETSAITTSVTSSSTDVQVPSAKAVYDNFGGLKLVKLTEAEYNALATKDNSTLYIIVS